MKMASKKVIDKGMIEEFGAKIDSSSLRDTIYVLSDICEDIAMELSQTNQLIKMNNVDILPFNDYSNVEILNSDISLYLTVKSAQIELNSIGPMEKKWRVFWNKVVNAWKNRRANTRKAKKKALKLAKKRAKTLTVEQLREQKEQPYNILSFKNEFFEHLVQKLTETTVLYNQPLRIRVLAREEFGFKINFYPAIKHDDGLKIWDNVKHKFKLTKPIEAKYALADKNTKINDLNEGKSDDIFYKIIRVFKNLYYNISQSYDYQFIESLIYNCPDTLFKVQSSKSRKSITYDAFIKILNYLNNTNISAFRSIYNNENTISEQDDITIYAIQNFIKTLNDYLI